VTRIGTKRGESSTGWLSLSAGSQVSQRKKKRSSVQDLRPVAQLYGQVRTDRNQHVVIDCSLSHPARHKPFTCSHCVVWLYVTCDIIFTPFVECVFLLAFLWLWCPKWDCCCKKRKGCCCNPSGGVALDV